jgi:hypothetical protein
MEIRTIGIDLGKTVFRIAGNPSGAGNLGTLAIF